MGDDMFLTKQVLKSIRNMTCQHCKGTGYKGIYHPITLELTVIKCDCKKEGNYT